jgi:hypothetical protein
MEKKREDKKEFENEKPYELAPEIDFAVEAKFIQVYTNTIEPRMSKMIDKKLDTALAISKRLDEHDLWMGRIKVPFINRNIYLVPAIGMIAAVTWLIIWFAKIEPIIDKKDLTEHIRIK